MLAETMQASEFSHELIANRSSLELAVTHHLLQTPDKLALRALQSPQKLALIEDYLYHWPSSIDPYQLVAIRVDMRDSRANVCHSGTHTEKT